METAALKAFVAAAEADPQLLHKPELAFFAKYLQSLGAKLPKKKADLLAMYMKETQ